MITPAEADLAFAESTDLGDCDQILARSFPASTAAERLAAIRLAHRRVLETFFGPKRGKKRKLTPAQMASRDLDGL